MPRFITGISLAFLIFSVIIGGVKRIARAASAIVPIMGIGYVLLCLTIIFLNINSIPQTINLIFSNAFNGSAALSGSLTQVILMGFKRGIFSNEAGLGSAPIAHASAQTENAVRQGYIAMLGTFLDTFVICSMTAFVILMTDIYTLGESGSNLSILSFDRLFPGSGIFVVFALILFAFTTIIGWSFYGERCCLFLFGSKSITPFRLVWIAIVVLGAIAGDRSMVWSLADTLNGLMALPNLIGLVLLSKTIFRLTSLENGR